MAAIALKRAQLVHRFESSQTTPLIVNVSRIDTDDIIIPRSSKPPSGTLFLFIAIAAVDGDIKELGFVSKRLVLSRMRYDSASLNREDFVSEEPVIAKNLFRGYFRPSFVDNLKLRDSSWDNEKPELTTAITLPMYRVSVLTRLKVLQWISSERRSESTLSTGAVALLRLDDQISDEVSYWGLMSIVSTLEPHRKDVYERLEKRLVQYRLACLHIGFKALLTQRQIKPCSKKNDSSKWLWHSSFEYMIRMLGSKLRSYAILSKGKATVPEQYGLAMAIYIFREKLRDHLSNEHFISENVRSVFDHSKIGIALDRLQQRITIRPKASIRYRPDIEAMSIPDIESTAAGCIRHLIDRAKKGVDSKGKHNDDDTRWALIMYLKQMNVPLEDTQRLMTTGIEKAYPDSWRGELNALKANIRDKYEKPKLDQHLCGFFINRLCCPHHESNPKTERVACLNELKKDLDHNGLRFPITKPIGYASLKMAKVKRPRVEIELEEANVAPTSASIKG